MKPVVTKLLGSVVGQAEQFPATYASLPDETKYLCMVDLVGSSNHRILNGAKLGYVRGETFFALIREVISRCPSVRLIKEMGDAVLLTADGLRPLLETVIIVTQVAHLLRVTHPNEPFPFGVRAGLGAGVIKKIIRPHEDFLGTPIDELARIMNVRSETSNILIDDDAYRNNISWWKEYDEFLSVSDVIKLPVTNSKGMTKNIYYRELVVSEAEFQDFNENFIDWREEKRNIQADV
ncbi:MAG: hypothetical protein ABL984_15445 [Pyrinomonadaceae bacterium]